MTDLLTASHGALAAASCGGLLALRAWHVGFALLAAVGIDAAFWVGMSWQAETALEFGLPAAIFIATANTVGASPRTCMALALPIVAVAAAAVGRGYDLGASGVAWLLVAANAYVAIVGTVLLKIGSRRTERVSTGLLGLVLATVAPAIVGWLLYAHGHQLASAAWVDCLFFGAIVVASVAEWIRRRKSSSCPSLPARFSTR